MVNDVTGQKSRSPLGESAVKVLLRLMSSGEEVFQGSKPAAYYTYLVCGECRRERLDRRHCIEAQPCSQGDNGTDILAVTLVCQIENTQAMTQVGGYHDPTTVTMMVRANMVMLGSSTHARSADQAWEAWEAYFTGVR